MVKPKMDMLSVLSTPCTKPTPCHAATRRAVRRQTSANQSAAMSARCSAVAAVVVQAVVVSGAAQRSG